MQGLLLSRDGSAELVEMPRQWKTGTPYARVHPKNPAWLQQFESRQLLRWSASAVIEVLEEHE